MNTIDKVKQWFIDRDLENGGRLDKQSLKLSEEFGELCAGYLKKNEQLTKDSIGDCAVVIVGLALLVKADVQGIFDDSIVIFEEDVSDHFKDLNKNISCFQRCYSWEDKSMCGMYLSFSVDSLKSISKSLGYSFEECFELAYQEIKDRKGRWIDGTFVKEEDLG
ncbi:DNA-binding protein [Streptococcus mitis 29/42]|uniref:DNA-binding protein n=1 Tax=Streptococcus mitis 29/42 TaxID=1340486 RepID=S7YQ94_STRMT|nr:DNA-binding protein [Streptococcus mitis 29/42]